MLVYRRSVDSGEETDFGREVQTANPEIGNVCHQIYVAWITSILHNNYKTRERHTIYFENSNADDN